jgi:carbon monoxide dehydrogenase subunit G
MHFEGKITIQAPREKVWSFLTDPEKVADCAPGVETMEVLAPNEKFRVVTALGFGTLKARFTTDVEWMGLEPPRLAQMKFHGTAAGSAVDGATTMTLSEPENGTTELAWAAEVGLAGTLASVGSRLMGGVAKKVTDAFFVKVRKKIQGKKVQGKKRKN